MLATSFHPQIRQKNRELYSLRCDFMYKLRVAQENRAEPALYFPHNVDFRGRAYTMHPHLNHLGADYCRGLLTFADARPLGERGLRWLRIQIANLYGGGADKLPLDQREQYVIDRMHEVTDSAADPLGHRGGRQWWQQAEDPWQCLAACYELTKAMQSPDPVAYMSTLPVQQVRRGAPSHVCRQVHSSWVRAFCRTGPATACSTMPRLRATRMAAAPSTFCRATRPPTSTGALPRAQA